MWEVQHNSQLLRKLFLVVVPISTFHSFPRPLQSHTRPHLLLKAPVTSKPSGPMSAVTLLIHPAEFGTAGHPLFLKGSGFFCEAMFSCLVAVPGWPLFFQLSARSTPGSISSSFRFSIYSLSWVTPFTFMLLPIACLLISSGSLPSALTFPPKSRIEQVVAHLLCITMFV